MSQNNFNLANQGFPSMRADINSALQALASNSSGSTSPSKTYAYQWWYDTSANILKIRNAADDAWINFASFDQGAGTWSISGDLLISDKIVHSGDPDTAIRFPSANTVSIETTGEERMRINSAGKILAAAGAYWEGTVSQSGQSSVFERDGNANGEYVKFADGTLICTHTVDLGTVNSASGSSFISATSTSWTFPATFIAGTAKVSGVATRTGGSGAVWLVTVQNSISTGGIQNLRAGGTITGATAEGVLTAVGRWY